MAYSGGGVQLIKKKNLILEVFVVQWYSSVFRFVRVLQHVV